MQDLPDHAAEPMSDGPNSGLIAQPQQQTPKHGLKITTVLLHRSVCRLVQYPPQIFIRFRGAATVVLFGTSFFPGQVPTQEVNSAAEGNVLACAATSVTIYCAESTPNPGTSAKRITAS
jgi:hypothetical protein